ncbi:DUF3885 domain-containing protein [Lysinibacillus sp. FSL W8-0992]|uniref:DUF3885 domain-containing protein n=1 Tax=Lysinibacillus sp. FSL W8-0992 TaxID=2954643 RepID=UPI0030FC9F1C
MQLNDFMHENYPNLQLRPPLFYSWDIGIRFKLGVNWKWEFDYPDNPYVLGCYKRAITLFEALHAPTENIFVVMDIHDFKNNRNLKRKFKNFPRYVNKSLMLKLSHEALPYIFPEDDEEGIFLTNRFTLQCKTSDFNYKLLLKAICNQDLELKPYLAHSVYFINSNRKTIFHVYDDRGCDLLATSPAGIKDIYERHNDWILDYDRAEIDKVFKRTS